MQDFNQFLPFLCFSQSGLDIIEAVRGHNPLTSMIADAVAAHIKVYGDGSKRIVQMLHFFLSSLRKGSLGSITTSIDVETRRRCDLIRQIQLLKAQLVPKLLQLGTYR